MDRLISNAKRLISLFVLNLIAFGAPGPIQAEVPRNIDQPQIYPQPVVAWGNSSYHDSLGVRDPYVVWDNGHYVLFYDCIEDLLNPSFESNLGTNGWDVYQATVDSTDEWARYGERSLRVRTNDIEGAGAYTGNYYYGEGKVAANLAMPTGLEIVTDTTYIASVYVRAESGINVTLWVKQYRDDPGYYWENWITTADAVKEVEGNDSWQRISVRFTTVDAAKAITISFVADPNTTTYWDAVQLERVQGGVDEPSAFPEEFNFNKPLEETIGWRGCAATSSDGIHFTKLGPLEVVGEKGEWENFERPGWVGSSFMYLNPFFYDGYWYAHTWESGYRLDAEDPFFIDGGGEFRRFGYGDMRAYLPTGFARSGLVRSKSLLGPYERMSQRRPVIMPEQLPPEDINSCDQPIRNENSTWGCEYVAASGVPQRIGDRWALFLSGSTSYEKDTFDWDSRKSPICGLNGITSGVVFSDDPVGAWTSTSDSRILLPSEVCDTEIVAEGPIYHFDRVDKKHILFINDIKHGSVIAIWTDDPLSTWPLENRVTIIGRDQIPWSTGPEQGAVGLPTVVRKPLVPQLNLYFAARPSYPIYEGWKGYLFHDIGLLTLNLPLFSNSVRAADSNQDGKVGVLDYFAWIRNFNKSTLESGGVGDFNQDGSVDGADFVLWVNNYTHHIGDVIRNAFRGSD